MSKPRTLAPEINMQNVIKLLISEALIVITYFNKLFKIFNVHIIILILV